MVLTTDVIPLLDTGEKPKLKIGIYYLTVIPDSDFKYKK
jgi:hypothetical protein